MKKTKHVISIIRLTIVIVFFTKREFLSCQKKSHPNIRTTSIEQDIATVVLNICLPYIEKADFNNPFSGLNSIYACSDFHSNKDIFCLLHSYIVNKFTGKRICKEMLFKIKIDIRVIYTHYCYLIA